MFYAQSTITVISGVVKVTMYHLVSPLKFLIIWDWCGAFVKCVCVQELCESRGGRPGLSVLMSLTVSLDAKQHWTILRHWSQFVSNMSTDIREHEVLHHHHVCALSWCCTCPGRPITLLNAILLPRVLHFWFRLHAYTETFSCLWRPLDETHHTQLIYRLIKD